MTDAPSPKPTLDLTDAVWLAAPGQSDGPQIAFVDDHIAMRNGADPDGPVLVFTPGEWEAFRLGAVDGEFDIGYVPKSR
ncbi:DUF397 domain-containing protein [Kitasatospora sp. NPDC057015]|uniref:DUF397 domain-containing protein n=1 Tax=Kitasatospora sp. NPDC057015 TaxID=3346001 RepID=UPI00362E1FDA